MNSSLLRPSLRAALVVSGLTVAVGCGSATTPEPTTPGANNTHSNEGAEGSSPANANAPVAGSTQGETLTPDGHCIGSWSEYSEACCAREYSATWSAEEGCVPAVMVGPFVPPEMNA